MNKSPVANAGPDATITLPLDSVLLDGSASNDPDGTISNFQWTKISGPNSLTINNQFSSTTIVKNLTIGFYSFELKITDNKGSSAKDTVLITVTPITGTNRPPIAIAGPDQTISLPTNTINLDGSGSTDPDNNITAYLWTKIYGPSPFNIVNANVVRTQANNLVQGAYQFELKVTDAGGLFSIDTVEVIVNPAIPLICGLNRPAVTPTMTSLGNLSKARGGIATASAGNKILFAGGYTNVGTTAGIGESRVDIYDITTSSWSTAELSVPRHGIAAATCGNKIFFAGGLSGDIGDVSTFRYSTVDIYDVSTNTWSLASLSEPRGYISSVTLGNKVFFAGGRWIEGGNTFYSTSTVDIYDLSTNTWSTSRLSEARIEITVAASNNEVYFAGGYSDLLNPVFSNKIDIYNSNTNSWSVSTLAEPKCGMAGIFSNDKLYWAGGYNGHDLICQVEIRNANTQSTTYDYLARPTAAENAFLIDNKIVFANFRDPFDVFDLNTNTWYQGMLPLKRDIAGIISVNNTIYMAGGWAYESQSFTSEVWKLGF